MKGKLSSPGGGKKREKERIGRKEERREGEKKEGREGGEKEGRIKRDN